MCFVAGSVSSREIVHNSPPRELNLTNSFFGSHGLLFRSRETIHSDSASVERVHVTGGMSGKKARRDATPELSDAKAWRTYIYGLATQSAAKKPKSAADPTDFQAVETAAKKAAKDADAKLLLGLEPRDKLRGDAIRRIRLLTRIVRIVIDDGGNQTQSDAIRHN